MCHKRTILKYFCFSSEKIKLMASSDCLVFLLHEPWWYGQDSPPSVGRDISCFWIPLILHRSILGWNEHPLPERSIPLEWNWFFFINKVRGITFPNETISHDTRSNTDCGIQCSPFGPDQVPYRVPVKQWSTNMNLNCHPHHHLRRTCHSLKRTRWMVH